jgi:hypothetical protein
MVSEAIVSLLLGAAVVVLALAVLERRRVRRIVRARVAVRQALINLQPLRVTAAEPGLLDAPDQAEGWLLVTEYGSCTELNDGARALLGLPEFLTSTRKLADLFVNGTSETASMLAQLRAEGVLAERLLQPARRPQSVVRVAGVSLPDRHGKVTGALLLIRRSLATQTAA